MSTSPTFRPRSCASSSHGETLPSWSSFVTRSPSPARSVRPTVRSRRALQDYALAESPDSPPRERHDTREGTGLGRPWHVIVLDDDHNTCHGVALALSSVLPGVSYEQGLTLADRIHHSGQAV